MLQGIRTVILSVALLTGVGAVFGVLVGALIDEILISIGVGAFLGANFGLAVGYGFLPESKADLASEDQSSG